MSRYLIRHIEAKYEKIDGQVWNTGDLFSKDNVNEGDIFRVNSPDHKFYVSKNGKWEPVDELPSGCEILGTLETRNGLSTQSADDGQYIRIRLGGEKYVIRQNGEWEPYSSDKVYRGWRLLKTYGTPTLGESCSDGKRVEFEVDGKKKTVFDEVQKEIKKDSPSRLHARRQMLKVFYPVKEVPEKGAGRKKNTKQIDMVDKMFSEIAPKYANRNGGYTRIVKIGPRKGDGAMEVLLELI